MQCPPFSGPFLPRMLISKSQVHLLCKHFSELRLFSIICLYSNLPKRQFRVLFQAQPSTVISATLELCHLFIVNSKHSVMQAFKLGPASWIQRTSIGRHHRTAGMNFRRVLVSTSSTAMERNSSTKDYLGKWKKNSHATGKCRRYLVMASVRDPLGLWFIFHVWGKITTDSTYLSSSHDLKWKKDVSCGCRGCKCCRDWLEAHS